MAGGEAAGRWVAIASSFLLGCNSNELSRADLEDRLAGRGPAGRRVGDHAPVDAHPAFGDQARGGALRVGEARGDDQIDELLAALTSELRHLGRDLTALDRSLEAIARRSCGFAAMIQRDQVLRDTLFLVHR